jgi:predicted glycosyltransferase
MKIWIDFINTPQVSFWVPFIKEFEKGGHKLLLTCRDSGNTVALLQLHGYNFHVIGESAGKGIFQKLFLFPMRLFKLYSFIRKNKPEIAAGQSSFYHPIISWLLRIPCMYTNDNEYAKGNLFGFFFANKVILPQAFYNDEFTQKWPLKSKVSFYPSVKEAIYLSQQTELFLNSNTSKNVIYFRPEPWSAQYYNGPLNFFDQTILSLSTEYQIVILPRDKSQVEHYKQKKFKELTVAEKPLSLKEIIGNCKLFIGAGGSMTRELAVLGIPVISVYQEEMLKVDRYLVDRKQLIVNPKISYNEIMAILNNEKTEENNFSVLEEGKQSFNIIKNLIINLN